MKQTITAIITLIAIALAPAKILAAVESQVFTYNAQPELRLTRYVNPQALSDDKLAPCIIFAFGGSFTHGNRENPQYLPYFEFMANRGYVVCSIDYRTTLSGFNASQDLESYAQALVGAINTATVDFFTATAYILQNAQTWHIDPSKIVASGSSAGAITALQAAFTLSTGQPEGFPDGFNYAAAVSFAGAILSQGAPEISPRLCPVMLFQGDADRQVPYNSLVLGPIGLYGSNYLTNAIKNAGGSGAFWSVLGADHRMAISPMTENLYDIEGFLFHTLNNGNKQFAVTTVTIPGTAPYTTDFSISDYVKANMP